MDDNNFFKLIYILAVVAVFALAFSAGFMVSDSEACRTATTMGMRACRLIRSHQLVPGFNGCGHDDAVAFEISATNASDQRIDATVCCGWPFKGCTLRTR